MQRRKKRGQSLSGCPYYIASRKIMTLPIYLLLRGYILLVNTNLFSKPSDYMGRRLGSQVAKGGNNITITISSRCNHQ